MKRLFLLFAAARVSASLAIFCLLLFTFCLPVKAQDSTSTTNVSTVKWRGRTSAPSLSTTGNAVCYFDNSSGKLKCSQNGGAFADWVGGGGGGGTPGGSNTQVQFNDSGSFGGDAGLVYNKTTNTLTIASGGLTLSSSPVNKVTITPPATGSTLTIQDGFTLTVSANANVSGTNTGDQTTVSGNAGTATALATARNINGVAFDGTANITVTAAAGTLSGSTLASGVTTSSLTSFGNSPLFVTPTLGVATATSVNKWVFTAPTTAATLAAGGDSLTYTMPASSQTVVGRSSTDTLTNKTFDTAGSGNSFSIGGQSITSVSGNTAKVVTTTGTLTSGDCVKIDANGNFVANGSACGSGGSGIAIGTTTITGGTDTKSLYNNAGVVGERTVTGTGNDVLSASPTLTGTVAIAAATFSSTLTQTLAPAANTSIDGLVLTDTTGATSGNQQYSPRLRLTAQGWKTNSTAASQAVDWIVENQPVQGAANPDSNLVFSYQINGGGYTAGTIFRSNGRISPSGSSTTQLGVFGNYITVTSVASGGLSSGYGILANDFTTSSASPSVRISEDGNGTIGAGGTGQIGFASGSASTSLDVALKRAAVNVFKISDGSTGFGWLQWAGEAYLATDQTNATATLTSTTLSVTLQSSRKYTFKAILYVSDDTAAEGVKADFGGGTATATNFRTHCTGFDTALGISTQVTSLTGTVSAGTFSGNGLIECHGSFEVNSGGTFIPRFAQNSHVIGTLTLFRGSHLQVFDTP